MTRRGERRVVVTGIGVIAPCGLTLDSFWSAVVEGRPSAGPVTHVKADGMPCRIACEVKGFDPVAHLGNPKAGRYDPAIQFGLAAAKNALADSGLDLGRIDCDRVGVVEGSSVCGLTNTVDAHERFLKAGHRGVLPTRFVSAYMGGSSSEIAIEFGITGQATTIGTACSSGNDAMAYACNLIQDDLADVVVAGANEAPIVGPYYSLFINTGVLSRRNHEPARAMRPFDRDRDGFVLGEGAAFLILEELTHALARGARIYCEWLGHGQSCDAYSSVSLHPEGRGMKRAIEKAIFAAEVAVDRIDYINCHGSATESNEAIETRVYKAALGERARTVAISATKPVTGHLMGATAAVEAAVCALAVHRGVIPPTANLDHAIAECDLDYVPRTAREYPVRCTMNVNLGFGGKCSAVILARYDGR